ncbi:MAG TPA: DUF4337 domain-containing protein [Pirellulales bacterium]|jgi:lipopolysaccharide export LptBFGC system permease protein LptF|nr:DUF4337 domain-containing protein [Pirellulales bacterium]
MEEIEAPMENVHEDIHEHAHHAVETWIGWVAMSTAVLAALAAVTALLSGNHANKAVMEQIDASDKWSHYQAKSIKSGQLNTKVELTELLGKPANEKDSQKLEKYTHDMEELMAAAKEKHELSDAHFELHEKYSKGVTMFQIAITIAAISVLTKRKAFWYVGLGFGAVGLVFFSLGLASDIPTWLHALSAPAAAAA